MPDIYDQHRAAFSDVSAFVVVDELGNRVATVALKFARSGLRTTAYVHLIGVPMVRAYASGGGYDKASAAVAAAIFKVREAQSVDVQSRDTAHAALLNGRRDAFRLVAADMDRTGWENGLIKAGYRVLQAV